MNTQLAQELRNPTVKLTYEDILSYGETNHRIELFDGEPVMAAMPIPKHQRIATRLGRFLDEYAEKFNLGVVISSPIDVVITEHTVLEPDLSFLSHERKFIDEGTRYVGAPDLVIEILSESTEKHDRTFKFQAYSRGGAKEYWIVSPMSRTIEVYQNSDTGFLLIKKYELIDTLNTSIFLNINLSVASIFE